MTKEEAVMFMDNLIICIKEHPILADWLVEIENRKTESNCSGKPNNSLDKDTNVRSKYDCKTCKHDLWHTPRMCGKCVRQEDGKPSMYEPKTEPQTGPCDDCERCLKGEYSRYEPAVSALLRYTCRKRKEPQTETSTNSEKVQLTDEPQTEDPPMDEYYKDHDELYDCDRYVVTNDEGERAYKCIGCEQTDCAWGKGEL